MKDNHTPGPWITYSGSYVKGPKGNTVADCRYKNGIADAEFIVRACNRYPQNRAESDLIGECLGALEDSLGVIDSIRADLALWMDVGYGKTNQECIRSLLYTMKNTNEKITKATAILTKRKGEL